MPPRDRIISLRFDSDVLAKLEAARQQLGVPVSEQIRRAVDAWLARGGVLGHVAGTDEAPSKPGKRQKAARPRARTRERA